MEKENNIPEGIKKIIIPKEGDIFNALTGEKKEPERKAIDRQEFIMRVLEDIEYDEAKISECSIRIATRNHNLQKMFNCETLGYKLDFYECGHKYGFFLKKRDKLGFGK